MLGAGGAKPRVQATALLDMEVMEWKFGSTSISYQHRARVITVMSDDLARGTPRIAEPLPDVRTRT